MEKTLTYYAIQNGKSAFGVEASKTFDTHYRAYYHLLMIEQFMDYLGIDFKRRFELDIHHVKDRIDNNVQLALYEKKIFFDMRNVKRKLSYVPIKRDGDIDFSASNPLIAVLNNKKVINVRYGNRSVTKLVPQYFNFDDSIKSIGMEIDDLDQQVELGGVVKVQHHFKVKPMPGYRVNVIGFTRSGVRSEHDITISKEQISKRYSIDRQGLVYRVEVYHADKFCGMVLVDFDHNPVAINQEPDKPLTKIQNTDS